MYVLVRLAVDKDGYTTNVETLGLSMDKELMFNEIQNEHNKLTNEPKINPTCVNTMQLEKTYSIGLYKGDYKYYVKEIKGVNYVK